MSIIKEGNTGLKLIEPSAIQSIRRGIWRAESV